jgi:hypothetical protein
MSENLAPEHDPAFAAVASVRAAEEAFVAPRAVDNHAADVDLAEARAAMAATVATTPEGWRTPRGRPSFDGCALLWSHPLRFDRDPVPSSCHVHQGELHSQF